MRVNSPSFSRENLSYFHILVVDDDEKLSHLLTTFLKKKGFVVSAVKSTEDAEAALSFCVVDLILLDIMLPDEDGLSFVKRFVENTSQKLPPVVFLSARGEVKDRLSGLSLGAHDYMTKPFEPEELFLRILSVLRHRRRSCADARLGDWVFLKEQGLLVREGYKPHILTPNEKVLLAFFLENKGVPLTREAIQKVLPRAPNLRSIDVLVARLRLKLEKVTQSSFLLQSVRGVGYIMQKAI